METNTKNTPSLLPLGSKHTLKGSVVSRILSVLLEAVRRF